jgi:hypothetical protein
VAGEYGKIQPWTLFRGCCMRERYAQETTAAHDLGVLHQSTTLSEVGACALQECIYYNKVRKRVNYIISPLKSRIRGTLATGERDGETRHREEGTFGVLRVY